MRFGPRHKSDLDETKTNVQAFYMRNISPNFQNGNMETRPVHPVT
ncbi:hypothetical protein CHCC20341_2514 [Bacillus licheniformis]|nr:hypothetical protein CHCC20369_4056 [Bacillus licheniformis]TWK43644.1 hypothetical protein CHCC20368_3537 [Bacillus licheniformis]TWK55578.1 hypothetical protein CHCC20344_4071 [Bacillus licheniformis]TWK67082.1 hypothetical protein CHCC20341_2514 [Bacillus licheniformis]TWM13859.1 hypothetical protein CHCC15139_3811 [Bacillus licheniformis]